jgi:hypothetical protein
MGARIATDRRCIDRHGRGLASHARPLRLHDLARGPTASQSPQLKKAKTAGSDRNEAEPPKLGINKSDSASANTRREVFLSLALKVIDGVERPH